MSDLDTDMPAEQLKAVGELFVEAHAAAPNGLSIEVGTRRGGSALYFLHLLEKLYGTNEKPDLFTIDPYGFKPYENGIPGTVKLPLYGEAEYLAMKALLAPMRTTRTSSSRAWISSTGCSGAPTGLQERNHSPRRASLGCSSPSV